jgi:hypothetical protein
MIRSCKDAPAAGRHYVPLAACPPVIMVGQTFLSATLPACMARRIPLSLGERVRVRVPSHSSHSSHLSHARLDLTPEALE